MENHKTIHLISQKGIEVRHPHHFMSIMPISGFSELKFKKVYNKNWWHFYPLLLLSIMGYIVAQTLALTLVGVLAHYAQNIPGFFESGGGVLLGIVGGLGMIVMHYEYVWSVFGRLPDRSKYKIKYY